MAAAPRRRNRHLKRHTTHSTARDQWIQKSKPTATDHLIIPQPPLESSKRHAADDDNFIFSNSSDPIYQRSRNTEQPPIGHGRKIKNKNASCQPIDHGDGVYRLFEPNFVTNQEDGSVGDQIERPLMALLRVLAASCGPQQLHFLGGEETNNEELIFDNETQLNFMQAIVNYLYE